MSVNCIKCLVAPRTAPDLLCDRCRAASVGDLDLPSPGKVWENSGPSLLEILPRIPFDDPNVVALLKSGRDASDIYLLDCPNCGAPGHYNQGSHFCCANCNASYACVTDDESPPCDRAYIVLGEEYSLADWNDADDGELP